ncbi:Hypothetical predicted protein [Podarcis lilfordi]|uniref:Uncharacterized protein n=1 Tax=Podarcis lilfordi TaxID=74358 RepID=A0AA35KY90_9SAUR|nr:Hypothetical predicted protein [Podarcis lilfordi]
MMKADHQLRHHLATGELQNPSCHILIPTKQEITPPFPSEPPPLFSRRYLNDFHRKEPIPTQSDWVFLEWTKKKSNVQLMRNVPFGQSIWPMLISLSTCLEQNNQTPED